MLSKVGRALTYNPFKHYEPVKKEFSDGQIIMRNTVDGDFAQNVVEQFGTLTEIFGDNDVEKLIILKTAQDAQDLYDVCPGLCKALEGDASIAYGIYDKKDKTICIIQDNHKRKDEKYEGILTHQGSDTLTHEFGHLIDKEYSKSDDFKNAYKSDLEEFERNLRENPDAKISDSDMTYAEAKEYFKHYFEGADLSDGINDADVTKTGHREQWAEDFSILYDQNENEANKIHKNIFRRSYDKLCEMISIA